MLSIIMLAPNTGNVVLKTNFGWREREGERENIKCVDPLMATGKNELNKFL